MNQSHHQDNPATTINDIRTARDHAEFLRDQLLAEWEKVCEDEAAMTPEQIQNPRRVQGRNLMLKAIATTNHAIASINQALRELERVNHDLPHSP